LGKVLPRLSRPAAKSPTSFPVNTIITVPVIHVPAFCHGRFRIAQDRVSIRQ